MNLSMGVDTGMELHELVEIVKEAERLGYTRCWLADEGIFHRDVFVALGILATQTNKIMLGTGITNPYIRHPAITAAAIATINELCAGRAFMGISAGGVVTLNPLGIVPTAPLKTIREMIICSRALFKGEVVSYKGNVFNLSSAQIPFSKGDIEIWLAARGNKMLEIGGELADGILLGPVHKGFIGDYLKIIECGSNKTGNKPKLCYSVSIISDEKMLNEFRSHMSFNIVDSPPAVKEALGIPNDVVEKIRNILLNEGPVEAGRLIKDEWIFPFVISGSAEECKAEIARIMIQNNFDEIRIILAGQRPGIEELGKIAGLLLESRFL